MRFTSSVEIRDDTMASNGQLRKQKTDSVMILKSRSVNGVNKKASRESLIKEEIQDGRITDHCIDSLEELKESLRGVGVAVLSQRKDVFELLGKALEHESLATRNLALEITAEIIPHLDTVTGTERCGEKDVTQVITKVISSMGHTNATLKKSAVHALHVYMKHFSKVKDIVKLIIKYGLESTDTQTRTEVMVALPILITPAFAEEDINELIITLTHRLEQSSVKGDNNPPALVCLRRIETVLGEDIFEKYIDRLPPLLQNEYKTASICHKDTENNHPNSLPIQPLSRKTKSLSSLHIASMPKIEDTEQLKGMSPSNHTSVKRTNSSEKQLLEQTNSSEKQAVNCNNNHHRKGIENVRRTYSSENDTERSYGKEGSMIKRLDSSENQSLHYGFIPSLVMVELADNTNYKVRIHGIEELKACVNDLEDVSLLLPYLGDFFEYLSKFLDDSNFKIALTSLYILSDAVDKVGEHVRPYTDIVLNTVQTRLGDSKIVMKQINMRIMLKLMQNLGPATVLTYLFPLLSHRNSKAREDVVNIITVNHVT